MKLKFPTYKKIVYDQSTGNVIPRKYSRYLIDMNSVFANSANMFGGRQKELKQIFSCLLKKTTPNVALLGPNGVGKTSIVQMLVFRIQNKKCPKELLNNHVIFLNIEKMIADLSISGTDKIFKTISDTFDFISLYSNLIVLMDQVHLATASPFLLYRISCLLYIQHLKIIVTTTEEDFYDFFAYHNKLRTMFDIIQVEEPSDSKIYPMIKNYVNVLESIYKVKISEKMINYSISVCKMFDTEVSNPGRIINFIEKSMVVAHRKKHNLVTKNDINSNFNFDYELFSRMSEKEKRITAYHEAGHYIVLRKSENVRNLTPTAISIVPAEFFLGITVFKYEPENQTSLDSDYYVDMIATDLAGRVAETFLGEDNKKHKYTSGAHQDLKSATYTAREIVTEYGMIEECGINMTYFCNYDLLDIALLSEERKKLIDNATQKLINIAYSRSEEILLQNRKLLDSISEALLQNDVLDETQLDELCTKSQE